MKIDIGSIVDKDGDSFEFSEQTTSNLLGFPDCEISIISDIRVDGRAKNDFGLYFVSGVIKFRAASVCDRCLERFENDYEVEFSEQFSRKADAGNEEIFIFRDNEADLSVAIVENIHVNIPVKLLCKPECKGLCSDCGSNLNEKQCSCVDAKINPQFAKLAKLINN